MQILIQKTTKHKFIMKFKCISKSLLLPFLLFLSVISNGAVFTVTQTAGNPWWPNEGLPGSLKEAVYNANNTPGRDTIVFDLPGGSLITGEITNLDITEQVFIDGFSLTDFSGNSDYIRSSMSFTVLTTNVLIKGLAFNGASVPLILSGNNNAVDSVLDLTASSGIHITGSGNTVSNSTFQSTALNIDAIFITGSNNILNNVTVNTAYQRALFIQNGGGNTIKNSIFSNTQTNHAISLENSSNNIIDSCTIFNATQTGVLIIGTSTNTRVSNSLIYDNGINGVGIGSGSNVVEDCIIHGNQESAVAVFSANNTVKNVVAYNNGLNPLTNAEQAAIYSQGANTIVDSVFVYGNQKNGVLFYSATASGSILRNSVIGRTPLGVEEGNYWNGVFVWSANTSLVENNTIVNNGKGAAPSGMPDRISGVRFQSVTSGTIRNNFIGTDVNKVVAGNDFDGITLHTGSSNVLIESNVIANNGFSINYGNGGGIALRVASNTNTIRANFIGVHPDDTPAANNDYGISIEGSSNNLIGGDLPVDGNKIAGASSRGIWIVIGSNNNEVYSNLIGNTNQTNPVLGNGNGIQIERNSSDNIIGKFGSGNVIAGNTNGIYVHSVTATGNTLRGNSFFCNTNQGILLEDGGNTMYGKPSGIKNVIVNSAEIRSGFISGYAPQNALVDIYVADTICKVDCDASPYQGLTYVTTVNASGDFNADVNGYLWEYDLTDPSNVGGIITKNNVVVLATQSTGTTPNTSEFSVCVPIPQCVPPANVSIIADQSICIGQSTTLRATADSLDRAVDNRYTWYKGSIDPLNEVASNLNDSTLSVSTSDTGLYYVVISNTIDENLCSGSNNTGYVFRANPLPNRTITVGKDTFCTGDSTLVQVVNNPNRTYEWNPNVTSSSSFYAKAGGTYKVIITNTTTGCIDSSTVTLTENLLPNINLSASDADFCDGDSVTIDAGLSVGYSFNWNPSGSVSNSIVVKDGGSYKVVVTNTTTGCIDSSSITITENPKATIDLGPDRRLCSNETLTLDAGLGWQSVIWNGNVSESNQTFVVNSGDSLYRVSVVNTNGCEGSDSVYVTSLDIPSISILGGDTILCSKGGATLTAISSYSGRKPLLIEWSNGSSDSTTIITVAPTNLSVSITDSNNCKVSDEILIDEFCEPTIIKLPNVIVVGSETNGYFTPLNPNNEDLANGVLISEVQIYDRWGIKVHESNELLPNWNGEFNNRPVSSGVYFWIWNYTDTSDKEYKLNGFVQVLKE